jgi:prepilin-type N-terminal cleavage/methylation domain-containing protein/prepilin-type processing-associated H-X9-DG protein
MERRAFTLIELLMVIAVIALLAAILYPSMSAAGQTARTVLCQNNLRSIGQAFSLRRSSNTLASTPNQKSDYPEPQAWPGVPMDVLEEQGIYICPEDDGTQVSGTENLVKLNFENEHGIFPLTLTAGHAPYMHARRSSNDQGEYTEWHLQDDDAADGGFGNSPSGKVKWHGWYDIDGFVRMYDNGNLYIMTDLEDTPDFEGGFVYGCGMDHNQPNCYDNLNTCGNLNAIMWEDDYMWGSDGRTRNARGQTFPLPNWSSAATSYGINSYAYKYAKGKRIVLVDYEASDTVVWLEDNVESESNLLNSGRHLGRVNCLMSDGRVEISEPLAISPRLQPEKWDPE